MRSHDPAPPADLRDAARQAEARATRRLALLAEHLAAPDGNRISDYEAAMVGTLIDGLVDRTVSALAGQPMLARVDLDGLDVPAASRDRALVEQALSRATEHRMATALKRRPLPDAPPPRVAGDAEAAALELALLVAVSARLDQAGDPLLPFAELSAGTAQRLAWRIGAAARARMIGSGSGTGEADTAIAAAVAGLLAAHLDGRDIATAATRFARRSLALADGDEADALLVAALSHGDVALFAALLAERAGLGFDIVHACAGEPVRLALMLRAAGVARPAAATLLLLVTEALGLDDDRLVEAVDGFAALDAVAAGEALALDRLDPAYRAAIAERSP